ncbi:hypothetical protein D3C87_1234420 [compost metagenome]
MNDFRCQATVNGWRCPEADRRINIVNAKFGGARGRIGNARLHADAITRLQMRNLGTGLDYRSGSFMAQHHRRMHNEMADFAMGVIMDVRAANPDGMGTDAHILGSELAGNVELPERELSFFFQHQCFHLILRSLRKALQRIQTA